MLKTALISALSQPSAYPHPTSNIEIIETHISWIILTGDYAYKLKKPVNLGFLDFTSLAQRKQYCEAELTLNARSAPEIYLGLVPISGTPQQPKLGDATAVIEYAIKMNQFGRGQLFSELQASGQLTFEHVDELAEQIAEFHQRVERAPIGSPYGQPEQVFAPMRQNFQQIRAMDRDSALAGQLEQLEAWTNATYQRLIPVLRQRQAEGFVREGHGDMHLGNITLFNNRVTLFDCIEFNDDFRWIDVINDVAFLVMDFEDHGAPHYAHRFLNSYLELTGDYAGLKLLSFFKAYRAVVRAKIILFTLESPHLDEPQQHELQAQYRRYIELADSCAKVSSRVVLTMHGISGTGKSTVALRLVDQLGLIRIRSDIERKRLFGLQAHEHSSASDIRRIYSEASTHLTYDKLCQLCAEVLDAGLSVIVDATNLKFWQRAAIQQVADERGVPVCIVFCKASMAVVKDWIQKRTAEAEDASEADLDVVAMQIEGLDPLSLNELTHTFIIRSDILVETQELISNIRNRFL